MPYFRTEVTGTAVAYVGQFIPTSNGALESVVRAPMASVLGPGTHTSTITVTACTSDPECTSGIIGTPQTISVTYTINVAEIGEFPRGLSYQITPNTSDWDFGKTLKFIANAPWSITSASSALSLSPSSGTNTSGTITVTLNRAATDAMPIGIFETQLTFNSGVNAPVVIPVLIIVRRPQAFYASPRVQISGGAGGVTTLLRGADLLVPEGFLGARYGQVAEIAGFVFDPTRYRSERPALTAGSYPMRLLTASGVDVAQPTLKIVVVDPLTLPGQVISYPSDGRVRRVSDLYFDGEQAALVLGVQYPNGSQADSQILRYTWTGSWSVAGVRSQPYLSALTPRVDGGWLATALINSGNDNALVQCDQAFTTCTNTQVSSAASIRRTAIGMTGDGQPLIVSSPRSNPAGAGSMQRYSLREGSLSPLDSAAIHDAIAVSSDDGSTVAIGSRSPVGGTAPSLLVWNSLIPTFTGLVATVPVDRLAIDGRATRVVVNGTQVYETGVMTMIGTLPATTLAAALNRSGSRAYTWDANGSVRIFNVLDVPVPAGSSFPEIAPAIVPAGDPGAGTDGLEMRMAVSPDERTLFMAGSARIVVVPVGGI